MSNAVSAQVVIIGVLQNRSRKFNRNNTSISSIYYLIKIYLKDTFEYISKTKAN